MGVSENSVPLNPMVLLIIIPFLNGYFIGNINPTFSDKAKFEPPPSLGVQLSVLGFMAWMVLVVLVVGPCLIYPLVN